jgi:hypothetical protein
MSALVLLFSLCTHIDIPHFLIQCKTLTAPKSSHTSQIDSVAQANALSVLQFWCSRVLVFIQRDAMRGRSCWPQRSLLLLPPPPFELSADAGSSVQARGATPHSRSSREQQHAAAKPGCSTARVAADTSGVLCASVCARPSGAA